MRWKLKASIQNLVSTLPSSLSYASYYWIQRRFGALRTMNPISRLAAGIEAWKELDKLGIDPRFSRFMEVGTGRVPMTPVAYWLMGADSVFTIDLNPYLKPDLFEESLAYVDQNAQEVRRLFGPYLIEERFNELRRELHSKRFSPEQVLRLCKITYSAPSDAARTNLPNKEIDFHTSNNVFEHIPSSGLRAIIREGNRVISDNGLFVHRVDYSDHFAHTDSRISSINFLQFSDSDWDRLAGNRYMYMNRLRHDDFLEILESLNHKILSTNASIDNNVKKLLESGTFQLADRFRSKSAEILSIDNAWIVSQYRHN